jgi:hypothetical protein
MLAVVAAVLVLGVLREAGACCGLCCRRRAGRAGCAVRRKTKVAVGK